MPYPNFIIAGPPKSGTTSVFTWLKHHPDVHLSEPKETYYLYSKDERLTGKVRTFSKPELEAYKSFFKEWQGEKVICEATPDYIYSTTAIQAFKEIVPDAKFLFIYRDPADRLFSEYRFHRYKTKRYKGDFASFIEYDTKGFDGRRIQESRFFKVMEKWVRNFANEQLLILTFEELQNDPRRFMNKLCRFLEIDPSHINATSFESKNKTVALNSRKAHLKLLKIMRFLPPRLVKLCAPLYYRLNSRPVPPVNTVEREILDQLKNYYEQHDLSLMKDFSPIIS